MSAANPKENTMYRQPVKRSLLSMPRWQAIGIGLLIIVAFGIVGHFDAEDEQAQYERYCEMVALWKADAARGIPANDRAGWPPFDGECK